MARLFLADGEDLLARFHPHPVSYLPRYGADALWAGYGALTFFVALRLWPGSFVPLLIFPSCALLHLIVVRAMFRPGWVQAALWAMAGLALTFLLGTGDRVEPRVAALSFLFLGIVASIFSALRTEFARTRRLTQVTNYRVVVRSGVARITERTIDLDNVKAVRAVQTPIGQAFGYGDLTLVLDAPRRGKEKTEPTERLDAVPNWDMVKHHIETSIQELRMPKRDRAKRIEERRLKESMRALAGWVGEKPKP